MQAHEKSVGAILHSGLGPDPQMYHIELIIDPLIYWHSKLFYNTLIPFSDCSVQWISTSHCDIFVQCVFSQAKWKCPYKGGVKYLVMIHWCAPCQKIQFLLFVMPFSICFDVLNLLRYCDVQNLYKQFIFKPILSGWKHRKPKLNWSLSWKPLIVENKYIIIDSAPAPLKTSE